LPSLDAAAPPALSSRFRRQAPAAARRACHGGPIQHRQPTTQGFERETDFSAEQPPPQADARLPGADAHQERAGGHLPAAQEGAQAPERLNPERLREREKLRRRADYLRCYRTGRRRHGNLAILYHAPNDLGHPRIGITASRKVGKAVVRQRLKRRTREVYRRWGDRERLPALDLVVHLKPEAREADFTAFRRDLLGLLAGLLPGRRER
jgi:ribonuclease P protein component